MGGSYTGSDGEQILPVRMEDWATLVLRNTLYNPSARHSFMLRTNRLVRGISHSQLKRHSQHRVTFEGCELFAFTPMRLGRQTQVCVNSESLIVGIGTFSDMYAASA